MHEEVADVVSDVPRVERVIVPHHWFAISPNEKFLEVPADIVGLHSIVEQQVLVFKLGCCWRTL